MMAEPRVIVVTHFPSPYQVELFNEIERQRPGELRVLYLNQRVAARQLERRADQARSRVPGSRQRTLAAAREAMSRAAFCHLQLLHRFRLGRSDPDARRGRRPVVFLG